jgi:hypothetical protein
VSTLPKEDLVEFVPGPYPSGVYYASRQFGERLYVPNGYMAREGIGPPSEFGLPQYPEGNILTLILSTVRIVVEDSRHLRDLDKHFRLDFVRSVAHQEAAAAAVFRQSMTDHPVLFDRLPDGRLYVAGRFPADPVSRFILGFDVARRAPHVNGQSELVFLCGRARDDQSAIDCGEVRLNLRTFAYEIAPAVPDTTGFREDEERMLSMPYTRPC